MSKQLTSLTMTNATSSPELAAGQLRLDLQDGQTTNQCGQEVAHANLSAPQESAKAKPTNATSGHNGRGSSASADLQQSLESKLKLLLPMAGGMKWPMIWKAKATPLGRLYCQLAVLARRKGDTGYGLWAAPNAMDYLPVRSKLAMNRQFNTVRRGRTAPSNLREQVQANMYPMSCGQRISSLLFAQTTDDQLNPAFVCWLMGFSTEYLSCMLSAMQSYRPVRQPSSKRIKGE